jgi:hypothetical protein
VFDTTLNKALGQYSAFLSYSWKQDTKLATKLHSALRVTKSPLHRTRRVFRDKSDLSRHLKTHPHLEEALKDAIAGSEFFVLLASPLAAKSEWVELEASVWIKTHGVKRLLVVVTSGSIERSHPSQNLNYAKPVKRAAPRSWETRGGYRRRALRPGHESDFPRADTQTNGRSVVSVHDFSFAVSNS